MKKIAVICAAILMGAGVSSAQYLCREQGTVFTYTETDYKNGTEEARDYTATVTSVATNDAGVVETRIEEVHPIPGNPLGDMKTYTSYTYNEADGQTVHVLLSGNDYKNMIVDMIVESARNAGQAVSDSDLAELDKGIKVKGDLTLPLPENAVDGAKIPNSTIKLNVSMNTMSMNLWEGKYLGYEDVEVPAGKFENCEKVSYVMKVNTPEGAEKTYVTAWYAKGIGVVKMTGADKKGKIQNEDVLKAIKK